MLVKIEQKKASGTILYSFHHLIHSHLDGISNLLMFYSFIYYYNNKKNYVFIHFS